MSHVDEGALHAYLDGALDEYPAADAARIREHLDGCAACARRLEEERAIRSEAHGILALAAPEVEAPSFEELRAYVRRTRPAGGASPRALRMRWAASVVLALGTGWLLRGGIPGPAADAMLEAPRSTVAENERVAETEEPARQERMASAPLARRADEADAGSGSVVPSDELRASETEAVPTGEEQAGALQLADRAAFAELPEAVGAPAADEATVAAAVLGEAVVEAAAGEDVAVAAGNAVGAGRAAGAGLPATALKVEPDDGVATVPTVTALADADVAARDAALGAAADAAPAEPADEEARRRNAPVDLPAVAALDRSAAPGLRARAPREQEADPAPATVRLTVPGYDVVSITNLGQGTEYYGVQAVQRLEGGSTFEIYHLEPGVERSVVPPPADGVGEAERLTADGWIVLQGPLPVAELEALLARLLPVDGSEG